MQIRKYLFSIDAILASIALVVLWGAIMLQVILRTGFNMPLMGANELIMFMVVWTIISPLGYLETINGHVVMEEFLVLLPERIIKILRFVIRLSTTIIYVIVACSVFIVFRNSMHLATPMLRMPFWFFFMPSAIGFGWVSIVCIIRNVCLLFNKEPPWAS